MEPLMIYILDEKIPDAQLMELLEKTLPLTKVEVVDLIVSKIDYQDETEFKLFEKKYKKSSFIHSSNQVKYDTYLKDLVNLENHNENLGTWNDPNELRVDLLTNLINFHIIEGKTVLYHEQIENWIKTASGYHLLYRKRKYLEHSVKSMKILLANKIEFSDLTSEDNSNGQLQNIGKVVDEGHNKKVIEKKIPEKWYALLHMIYVNMDKYKPFVDFSNKKFIEAYGVENYPLKGKGQMFYKAISQIHDSKSIYNYFHIWLKKDFWKWKRIITEISDNDPAIKLWIDRNKM
jgi:hypothetical protein